MQGESSGRRLGLLAAAIVVAALLISGSILATPGAKAAQTSTTTVLDTASVTATSTSTLDFTTTISSTTTVTNSSLPPVPCDNNALTGQPANTIPVLLMQPSSTGYLCVVFRTAWAGNETLYASTYSKYTSDGIAPWDVNGQCTTANGKTTCGPANSNSFDDAVTPNAVSLSGSMDYFTVVYVYTALGNATVFYNYGFAGLGCGQAWPLAVGYPASEVNSSDFHILGTPVECPAGWNVPVASVSAYLTGMNVTFVALPQQ